MLKYKHTKYKPELSVRRIMDWKDYMDDERAAKIAALAVDKDIDHLLTPQKTIKTAAILGGMVGLDRFLLGDMKKGVAKLIAFVVIVATFIALFSVICIRTIEAFPVGMNYWSNIVEACGAPLSYSLFVPVAAFIVFVGAVVLDGIACVKKNAQNNFCAAVQALQCDKK